MGGIGEKERRLAFLPPPPPSPTRSLKRANRLREAMEIYRHAQTVSPPWNDRCNTIEHNMRTCRNAMANGRPDNSGLGSDLRSDYRKNSGAGVNVIKSCAQ